MILTNELMLLHCHIYVHWAGLCRCYRLEFSATEELATKPSLELFHSTLSVLRQHYATLEIYGVHMIFTAMAGRAGRKLKTPALNAMCDRPPCSPFTALPPLGQANAGTCFDEAIETDHQRLCFPRAVVV